MRCPNTKCGFDGLPKEARFCPICGKEIPKPQSVPVITIHTNLACQIIIEGKKLAEIGTNESFSLKLNAGKYNFQFICIENNADQISDKYKVLKSDSDYKYEVVYYMTKKSHCHK
jgi:uncharacterized membrane protein